MSELPHQNVGGGNPKVPIPRLYVPPPGAPATHSTHTHYPSSEPQTPGLRTKASRVAHACERCKARKIKCDGERPTCDHCRRADAVCRYSEKKKDTEKRRVQDLEARVDHYEKLLRYIQPHLTHSLQMTIEKAINGDIDYFSQQGQLMVSSPGTIKEREHMAEIASMRLVEASRGRDLATSSNEHISQDINTFGINNPFGWLGKRSPLWWIQRAREEISKSIPHAISLNTNVDPRVPAVEKLDATMYHLDDLGMPEADREISPFTIPSKDVADVLVDDYFHTVHPTFPILSQSIFLAQFDHLYKTNLEPLQAGPKWLGIFNLVLAIGRSHCNLTENRHAGYDNQADYFMRARILGALDGGILFQVPDLQQVQMLGLTAKYLMANHRINRAWNVNSLAICQAQGLGLHLESDAPTLDKVAKDMRNCVWHALYSIETALVLVTGRVPIIREVFSSVPVPGNTCNDRLQVDEQGNTIHEPYLYAQRGLFSVINDSVLVLYNTENTQMTQNEYQDRVEHFEARLQNWKSKLPAALTFDPLPANLHEDVIQREKRLDLAVRYHNTRMIIHRPFLCPEGPDEDLLQPTAFGERSAKACIESARAVIEIVTNEDPQHLMQVGPWWSLIHFLATAASVILLELAFRSKHLPDERGHLFELGDRVVFWFKVLQHVDLASHRCYIVMENMMRLLRLQDATPVVDGQGPGGGQGQGQCQGQGQQFEGGGGGGGGGGGHGRPPPLERGMSRGSSLPSQIAEMDLEGDSKCGGR